MGGGSLPGAKMREVVEVDGPDVGAKVREKAVRQPSRFLQTFCHAPGKCLQLFILSGPVTIVS